ncbi:MAG TPA: amidohydrolase family protein [Candidatus Dormibacteraeota bacterium]|nr:amidohydrolase family protein [Candidatus Dormibacteraeota bacterium]
MAGFLLAGGSVLDVGSGKVERRDVAVADGVVVEPGSRNELTRVDCDGLVIMFGLWDVHAHPAGLMYDLTAAGYFERSAQHSVRAGANLLQALSMGVTGVRTAAEADGIDIAWRDAIARGRWAGPRIKCSGPAIRTTGGHGTAFPREYVNTKPFLVADGPTEMRRAVRSLAEQGADWVKILLTGGLYSVHETVDSGQLSDDELEMVMATARQRGLPALAHCGSARLAEKFVNLGGRSVEHGYALDEAAARTIAAKEAWLVPTIGVTHDVEMMRKDRWPEHAMSRAIASQKKHAEAVLACVAAGVKIATGADLNPIGPRLHAEIRLLESIGLERIDVLRAATAGGRELNGLGPHTAPVAGTAADLIFLEGNPLDDLAHLAKPLKVMVYGRFMLEAGALPPPSPGAYV